jgi:hypothetical protein
MKYCLKKIWWVLIGLCFYLFFRGACSGVIGGSVTSQGPLTIYTPGPDLHWLVYVSIGVWVLAVVLGHFIKGIKE